MKRILVRSAVVLGALLCIAIPAGAAQAGPYGGGGISISNPTPAAGGTESVSVDGCTPGAEVGISLGGTDLTGGTADANGSATVIVTIPSGLAAGTTQTITSSCLADDGSTSVLSASITVAGTTTAVTTGAVAGTNAAGALPRTGASHLGEFLVAGLVAVLLGSVMVVVAYRRRQRLA